MKPLSNTIPFDFVLKIKFDRGFIFKKRCKKSEHLRGNPLHFFILTSNLGVCFPAVQPKTEEEKEAAKVDGSPDVCSLFVFSSGVNSWRWLVLVGVDGCCWLMLMVVLVVVDDCSCCHVCC